MNNSKKSLVLLVACLAFLRISVIFIILLFFIAKYNDNYYPPPQDRTDFSTGEINEFYWGSINYHHNK